MRIDGEREREGNRGIEKKGSSKYKHRDYTRKGKTSRKREFTGLRFTNDALKSI